MHYSITLQAINPNDKCSVSYSTFTTQFGECLVASTDQGICAILFFDTFAEGIKDLTSRWPKAEMRNLLQPSHQTIKDYFKNGEQTVDLSFVVRGTDFQVKVWNALLTVPKGSTTTYGEIARRIKSTGFQAVGGAIGNNPIGYIVPCHRVIQSNGSISGYRWGVEKKRAMLEYEGIRI